MKSRNGALDLWKFIFACVIVLFHSRHFTSQGDSVFTLGYLAVEFFFITSGALMASSIERADRSGTDNDLGIYTLNFMKHKVFGLLPNYYVAWVIAFAVEHIFIHDPGTVIKDLVNSVWELLFLTEVGLRPYVANNVTWYISAMLIVMLILCPLVRKYRNTYYYVIAPAAVIFLFGLTFNSWHHLGGPHLFLGPFYKSIVRAFICIMIGTIAYKAAVYIRDHIKKTAWRTMVSIFEIGGYVVVLAFIYGHDGSKWDWTVVMIMAFSVTLTISQAGILAEKMHSSVYTWLGTFSYSLFLGHGFWSQKLPLIFPDWGYYKSLLLYVIISFATGLAIMYISKGIRKVWKKHVLNAQEAPAAGK